MSDVSMVNEAFQQAAGPIDLAPLNHMASEYDRLDREIRELDEQMKNLKAQRDEVAKELGTAMIAAGLDRIKVNSIGTFRPDVAIYASITKGNTEQAFAWLREHGLGGLIQETVNPRTLSAVAKELRAAGQILPECISSYERTSVSLRRARGVLR